MKYKQLTIQERELIQYGLWKKKSIRQIAKEIKRSPSSVSRELKMNYNLPIKRHYIPRVANERAIKNRSRRGREERLKNASIREYVAKQLKIGWSPEQIANTSKDNTGESISHEAIYQYVYAQIWRDGHGEVKKGCEDLRPYLARRRRRRMRKGMRKSYRIVKGPLPSINERPQEVDLREIIGHWEDDLIVSRESSTNLKTINELKSGLVIIEKVRNATIKESNRAILKRLKRIPRKYRKTLTRDRGLENMGYKELEERLGIDCYFANAYHSWERGANENLNGLIRRFLPKKTDFNNISNEDIKNIEYLLNSRPRKRLGWKTPYEVFYNMTGVALES